MSEEPLDTSSSSGMLRWEQVLFKQSDRIFDRASQPLGMEPKLEDAFRNSIRALDNAMEPYTDDIYRIRKQEIMMMDEPQNAITTLDEFFKLWGALCSLMCRCGLMPIEEGTLYDTDVDTNQK